MGANSTNPYTSQAISGYNASPPSDDGAQTSNNQVEWAKEKTKLADPIKTLAEAVNSAMVSAGAKTVNTDADVGSQISGSLALQWATATLATDGIVPSYSAVAIGSESGATSDTLQVLSATATAIYSGALLVIKQRNATEEINVIHATSTAATATGANIYLNDKSNFSINERCKSLTLQYDNQVATSTGWYEVARGGSSTSQVRSIWQISSAAVSTGTTALPWDDTIPNDSEGDQFLSVHVQPTRTDSDLHIVADVLGAHSSGTNVTMALFTSTATAAIAATSHIITAGQAVGFNMHHIANFASTATREIRIRLGGNTGSTFTFNGATGARQFGGVASSRLTVYETATAT